MSQRPTNQHRPDSRATVLVLTVGTIASVTVFALGFAVRLVGQPETADLVSTLAVAALLATPPVSLVASAFELRPLQPLAAVLALLVVAILAVATLIALSSAG